MKLNYDNNNLLLSVIMPVYNAERFLVSMLDSILAQSYSQYEVILVNDGSTDQSSEICEQYRVKFSNFKVVNQPNQGFGIARNTGLKNSSGTHIYFVDADDILLPDLFRDVMQEFTLYDYDTIFFGFQKQYLGKSKPVFHDMLPPDIDCRSVEDVSAQIGRLLLKGLGFGVWQQIFSKSFLQRTTVQFPDLKREADIAFVLQVYEKLQSFRTLPKVYYHYQAYYSTHKNNPDIVFNHIILFGYLQRLTLTISNQELKYDLLLKYFVLWFCHVIPLHIYMQRGTESRDKIEKLDALFSNINYNIYLREVSNKRSGTLMQRILLAIMNLKSPRLLYFLTIINHTIKYKTNINYKRMYYGKQKLT